MPPVPVIRVLLLYYCLMPTDDDQELASLGQMLDRIGEAAQEDDRISLGKILEMAGHRSFGPILLIAGLTALAPVIGDIPGMPTIIGVLVFLVSVQLLFGRKHFWLPRRLLELSVAREKLVKGLEWSRTPARFIDRLLRPRLQIFARGTAAYLIAFACILIAAAMPVMEVVPFSANLAGIAVTAFGLSLIARDGLLALFALVSMIVTIGLVAYALL